MQEAIAAIASPPGVGAISLIRVSGRDAFEKVSERLSKPVEVSRRPVLRKLRNREGAIIDEVLVTHFEGPASFTGEDVVEICGHGGLLVTQRVLESLLDSGVRLAREGEFSERAFFNGKLDLTQAEAIMDLISASSDLAIQSAHDQLSGNLRDDIESLRAEVIALLGQIEAYIDFPEEDISPETGSEFSKRLDALAEKISGLLETAESGRMLREGVRTVIAGAPNAGKSSLLNQLLGFDRAIVSATAGTTRDTVEEVIHFSGVPVRLVDTAGLRQGQDEIERMGIERSEVQLSHADLVLEVVDASQPAGERVKSSKPQILILNKSDLGVHSDWADALGISISCKDASGLKDLSERIKQTVLQSYAETGGRSVAINQRHRDCLTKALSSVEAGRQELESGMGPEFAAVEFREALEAIGEVTGKVDTEEILGEIFAKFCIGK